MWNCNPSVEDEIRNVSMRRRHVFILGAGASKAAFPNGDRNGIQLPVMADFVKVLGLAPILEKKKIDYEGRNFEVIYSELHSNPKYSEAVKELELAIRTYFSRMELPDVPTIYDHLVLSLRDKDLIATFNWDPFLWQVYRRWSGPMTMPHMVYLHGSVAVGYCLEHRVAGAISALCRTCGKRYSPTKLMYPIEKKNYNSDPYLSVEWKTLSDYLNSAYMLTIYGYGAPESDVEAIEIMQKAWGKASDRNREQIEIIDTKSEDKIRSTWRPFIHSHHYQVCGDFYDSWVANHPRRSCEAMCNRLEECQFLKKNSIPRHSDFDQLLAWYQALVEAEMPDEDT